MENYDNAIFQYNKNTILLKGRFSLTGAQINQTLDADDPIYVDWSTLKLKIGDSVYYNKRDTNNKGLIKPSFTPTQIGVISVAVTTTRVTVGTTIADSVLEDFENNNLRDIYVNRNLKNFTNGNCYYSYPLNKYIGIVSYDDFTLSLFFERTSGLIDEARVFIKRGHHKTAIMAINKAFRFSKNKDIFFGQHDSLISSDVVRGVSKVISTVPMNRN